MEQDESENTGQTEGKSFSKREAQDDTDGQQVETDAEVEEE